MRHILSLLFLFSLFLTPAAEAQDRTWREAGVRYGYIDTTSGIFEQAEAYVTYPMRTHFTLGDWDLQSYWEMSAGELHHDEIDGAVFTAGPITVIRKDDEPWYFEIGSRPTLISEVDFDDKHFGGPFQFTSHAGLGWSFGEVELSYRIQHMSNARIYSENDGVNLHVIELGWTFGD